MPVCMTAPIFDCWTAFLGVEPRHVTVPEVEVVSPQHDVDEGCFSCTIGSEEGNDLPRVDIEV